MRFRVRRFSGRHSHCLFYGKFLVSADTTVHIHNKIVGTETNVGSKRILRSTSSGGEPTTLSSGKGTEKWRTIAVQSGTGKI